MEHKRQIKMLSIIALVIAIAGMSLGFAAFSTTLNISSNAAVTPNSSDFSIKFSSSQYNVTEGAVIPGAKTEGLNTTNGVIVNGINPTLTNLSATFTEPNQYVVYTVYVRNEGSYNAYMNQLNFLGDKTCIAESGTSESLVQSACESISISVYWGPNVYSESTQLTNEMLEVGASKPIHIRLAYETNGTPVDGPFRIAFPSISLVYSTVDDPSMGGKVVRVVSGDINTIGSIVAIGNEQFYVYGKENGNVKLLSMYNLRVGNSVDESGNVTPLTNVTGIQDSSARGFVEGEYPIVGTTACSTGSALYAGSIVGDYVNNYKAYLQNSGVTILEARLITTDELIGLRCSASSKECYAAPNWVDSTSYWIIQSETDQPTASWAVSTAGFYGYLYSKHADKAGVRPVIVISESEF